MNVYESITIDTGDFDKVNISSALADLAEALSTAEEVGYKPVKISFSCEPGKPWKIAVLMRRETISTDVWMESLVEPEVVYGSEAAPVTSSDTVDPDTIPF